MTIQEQLSALLTDATTAGSQVYPVIAPDQTVAPYISYQIVATNNENILSGSSGLVNSHVQIDIYSPTYLQSWAIAAQVDVLMSGWSVQNVSKPAQDLYDETVKLFRVMREYSIWHP